MAEDCQDRVLSNESMVIGTSAIIDTEIDGAVGINSGEMKIKMRLEIFVIRLQSISY